MIKIDQNDLRIRSEIINDYFYHASVFDDSKLIDTSVHGVHLLCHSLARRALIAFKRSAAFVAMSLSFCATVDFVILL